MKNLAYKVKNARLRKLPVLMALVAALVVPGMISAYAQEGDAPEATDPLVVANVDVDGQLQTEQPATDPVEETPPAPTVTDTEPPVTPAEQVVEDVTDENITNDESTEDPVEEAETPAEALQRYIDFATSEHPGVAVAEVKFVWKNGVKSAKIVFEDGWKVYVGVSDGSTLSVADEDNKVHRCQRRMKHWKSYFNWHKQNKSYYEWWKSQQNQQEDAADDESDDGEVQSIQDTNTRNTSTRGTQHYKDSRYSKHSDRR